MVNINLPEPVERECVHCFKKGESAHLKGRLIHWPSPTSTNPDSFSTWLYKCRWCRGVETKKRRLSTTPQDREG